MLRFLLLLPFLVLLVAFALSNPQPVPLGLWPTDFTVEVPVSLAILAASGLFFFLGALFVWFGTVAARNRHRRAERRAAALEAELKAQSPSPLPRGVSRPTIIRPALAAPK
jgi:uncharacterized integral membrane protein